MMTEADRTNILVVDDLPEKHLVYKTILEELGQNLVFVHSGPDALRQVLQRDFAVILMDVSMPGMDGLETAALIRQRKKSAHVPIIFITAFSDEVRAAQGYAHGAVDYILSPVVPEVLRAKVRVFVDLFQMTQQVKRQAEERIALAEERTKRAAAEESNRRLSFLAQACNVLGKSLDYQVTARDLAWLPVPFLADLSAVALAQHPDAERTVVLCQADGDRPCVDELAGRERLPAALATALDRVLAGGSAELLPEDFTRTAGASTTAIVLPLQARGRVCAALALSREASGRHFGPAELSMAETLASRAAVALDNAQLYQDVEKADRQKNEFLSMLSHELRNPLAPIRNAVHVLKIKGQDSSRLEWASGIIDRQVKHLTRLVDDLLDVSRITGGKISLKMEPVEMATVVAEAVEASRPLIEGRCHHLEVSLAPGVLVVQGDAARLAQILTNLLNNAAKYTDEGGRIWLSVAREAGQVVVRVRDTGVGISREMLSAIFNLFTQADCSLDRSQGGLGIGLTLVRRLVEMHGGSVEARSEGRGQGSELVVRLPALADACSRPAPGPGDTTPEPPCSRCKVLVVDDNLDAGESLGMLLRLGGADVRVVHEGPAALELVGSYQPDLILLDLGLPGMDGYEVARRLRQQPAGREVILAAVTGYGQDEDRNRSREAGFDHHFVKPVDLKLLQEVLSSLAKKSPSPIEATAAVNNG